MLKYVLILSKFKGDVLMDLSIIIVNFNGGSLVDNCLKSIFDHPPAGKFEVVFVDNASTDGSFKRVSEAFPQIICIAEESNLGLAKAFNKGLNIAKGRYILSLDNDTRVTPNALQALMEVAEQNPAVGIVGSVLLNPDESIQRTFRRRPSAINAIFGRRSWITKIWPSNPLSKRYLMDDHLDNLNNNDPFRVDWVSTAALMITRDALQKVGGLDEDFFVYWVDADWCERVRKAGFQIFAAPASRVYHDENLKAKRRSRKSARMIRDFHRGAYLYYRKNHASAPFHPMAAIAYLALTARANMLIFIDYLKCEIFAVGSKS